MVDVEVQDVTGRNPPGKGHTEVRTILIRRILLKCMKDHMEQIERQVNNI